MQRCHPECSADSCTLSACIAKSSHQTHSPGHLSRCSFAAILSVMWHLAVDTEFRQQKRSAESLESLYSNKEQQQKAFPFRFQFNTVFLKENLQPEAVFSTSSWKCRLKSLLNNLTFCCLLWKYWNEETLRLSFVVWRYCHRHKCDLFVVHLQKHGRMTSQEMLLGLKL